MKLNSFFLNRSHKKTLDRAIEGLVDEDVQKRLIQESVSMLRVVVDATLTMAIAISLLFLCFEIVDWVHVYGLLGFYTILIGPFLGIAIGAVMNWLTYRLVNKRIKRRFAEVLLREKIRPHFCIACNYDLKGSLAASCPECGEPLAPVSED